MMNRLSTTDRLERSRTNLLAITALNAAMLVLGGMASKSSRWTGPRNGEVSGWVDGVKPWAVWALLGGMLILALLSAGLWSDHWITSTLAGFAGMPIFRTVGVAAGTYRTRLEISFPQAGYERQDIALGLYLTPAMAPIGAICAALLALISGLLILLERGTGNRSIIGAAQAAFCPSLDEER